MSEEFVDVARDSAKGGFSLFLGDALSMVVLAAGSILIARLLGPSGYGLYHLALVVPLLLASLVSLGIGPALIRFPAKLRAESKSGSAARILRSGFLFTLFTGAAMSVVGFAFSEFFATYLLNKPEIGFYVKLASLVILFQTIFSSAYYAFVGLDRMERSSLIKGLMSVLKASVAPLLIISGFGVTGAILGHVIGYVGAGIMGVLILFFGPYRILKSSSTIGKSDDGHFLGDIKLMVGYGFPLYLLSLLIKVGGQYQLILLAFYVSNLEIGNFNAAVNLSAFATILMVPIATALFPAFSKLSSTDRSKLKRFFGLSVKYTSLLIVPASIGVMVLSKEIVHIIYGPGYGLTPQFLSLYVVVFLFAGLGHHVLESFFNGVGETKLTLKTYLVSIAIFIPLAPLLTKIYGVIGLISVFLASNLARVFYGLLLAWKRFMVTLLLSDQLKIYIASAIPALPVLLFLRFSPFGGFLNLVFGGSLFLFTYLTAAPMLGAVRMHDIENLKRIFSGFKIVWPVLKPMLDYETKLVSRSYSENSGVL